MNGRRQSDGPIVPKKHPNNGGVYAPAEGVEGRGQTKENSDQQTRAWTQRQISPLPNALDRIREVARKDKATKFTALWHHVYEVTRLEQAYFGLTPQAAPGIDGQTWRQYGENLRGNLEDLSLRLKQGSYRAKAVRRVYIPKTDGRQRPIGVPALEDKIVQRAAAEVLNAVYEADFYGFSYGFRPGRSAHDALDALTVAIETRRVNWVLDADIRGFFDTINHEWLVKFIQHRIADPRVERHVKKWLKAGVMEDGIKRTVEQGTPQGGSISPLLANIYLHYAFDNWVSHWRKRQAHGAMCVVRYADDFVVGFEHREDAERFWAELKERFQKFDLELHEGKTRLIEFGRHARTNRQRYGQGKPETFDFLGFTHICGTTRKGRFCVLRRTSRKRLRAKLASLKQALRQRMHLPIPVVGRWLGCVVAGFNQYHGVPRNRGSLSAFRHALIGLWMRTLRRRSHRHRLTWHRFYRLVDDYIPVPRILHPYPHTRLRQRLQGRSPVR
jgi:group II intron reverse transcriptase/maturase